MSWFKPAKSWVKRCRRPRRPRPLHLEPLEARSVPAIITPTTFADSGLGSGSLRDAVLQFNSDTGTDDDIIQLLPGTYSLTIRNVNGRHETAGLTGDLNLTQTSHRWIIQGAGPSTIIDASQLQDRVFQIVNPGTQVVFQDLTLTGGLAQDNGSDGAVAGTTDALGGGILNNGGDLALDNVVVQNNVARGGDAASLGAPGHGAWGGGFYSTGGALTLAGATIANNQVTGGRGGDHNSFQSGTGGLATGGGVFASVGSLDISDSRIASNRTTGGRGGDGSATTITGGGILGGSGGTAQGGGLYVNGSALTISTSTIASNQANGGPGGDGFGQVGLVRGGGLYLYTGGTLTVSNSTLSGNSATGFPISGGGAIFNDGRLTVSNSTLSGNSAAYSGGGAISNYGTLTVSNSTLSGNSAPAGGGIYNSQFGTVTVSNSTLSGNSAGIYSGGGIANSGTVTVSDSTLSGNSAGTGGGIYNGFGTHLLTLTNVTLTANRANTVGGAFYHGGGLYISDGSPVLHNTLIAGNFRGDTGTAPDDVYGALDPSGDYNLIGDGTGMTGLSNGVNGNQVGSASDPIDPLLGPLQYNGGPTQTMALQCGSPAIDAGDNTDAPDWDQRGEGFPRIVNDIIDIGAYEVQPGECDGSAPHGSRDQLNRFVGTALVHRAISHSEFTSIHLSADVQMNPVPLKLLDAGATRTQSNTLPISHRTTTFRLAQDSFFMELEFGFPGIENLTQQN